MFFPEISSGIAFTNELQKRYMNEKIAFVASTSKNRYEYVEAFRKREISILVSTSILERGVTFPFVDVFFNAYPS
ncbi:helicase-related protein [Lactococcus fujiensis]|uniref:helicase-related protein n=1 Tax=Lactococcus fujiensis TaxID=610251 RepID=UPI00357151B7